jgi:DNA repair exonuclease SbcCD ATPase subunit
MGIFESLWRFVSFYQLRKAMGLARAADAQFTSSADGISDAFDIHREKLVNEYRQFLNALSEVENAVEQKRNRLISIQKNKKEAEHALEGALSIYEEAQTKGDKKTMDDAEKDGNGFRADVNRLADQEKELAADIESQQQRLGQLENKLSTMQAEIAKLPSEKADAIADFVSNKKLVEASERLMGIRSSIDTGPIDAVRKANEELAAKARVAGRIAGTDAQEKREKYLKAGEESAAGTDFQKMLAARKAEREQSTGSGSTVTEDRPKI